MWPKRVRRRTRGECDPSIARHAGLDFERPSLDPAGDVAYTGEAATAEELGHAQAASAVVAVDEEVFIGGEVGEVLRNLAHGDGRGAGDGTEGDLVRFAHVDEQNLGGRGGEEAVGFLDVDFERDGGVGHGKGGWGGSRRGGGSAVGRVALGIECREGGGFAAQDAGRIAGKGERFEARREGVVGEEATNEGFADAGEELDDLEGLQAADDTAQGAEHAGFGTIGHEALGGRRGKKTTVARTAEVRGEHGDLALEFKDAAVNEGAAGEDGGVVVKVAGGEVIGAIDDHVVGGEEREGVGGGDAFGVKDDVDKRIERAETGGGRGDFGCADGGVVVEDLALQVGRFNEVEISEAEGADAGGGEVKRGGATEAAGADDKHAGVAQAELAGHPDFRQRKVPTVAGDLGRRE